jgi:hypothetical protein
MSHVTSGQLLQRWKRRRWWFYQEANSINSRVYASEMTLWNGRWISTNHSVRSAWHIINESSKRLRILPLSNDSLYEIFLPFSLVRASLARGCRCRYLRWLCGLANEISQYSPFAAGCYTPAWRRRLAGRITTHACDISAVFNWLSRISTSLDPQSSGLSPFSHYLLSPFPLSLVFFSYS